MYTQLKKLVKTFEGDAMASCFANKKVKKVCECSETVMFQTENGILFEVYKSKLK